MAKHEYAETIESLSAFMAFIESSVNEFDNVLFRGQAEDWPLLPKLARLKFRGNLTIRDAEEKMLTTLKTRSTPFIDSKPENDWEWLSIAQHHGMATRLLDWSTNPLTALWFAVEKPAIENNDGVVWVFTPDAEDHVGDLQEVNPFKAGLTKVFMPKHINKRIAAQHGWFTVHYLNPSTSKFIKLENNKNYKDKLMKLRIPTKAFQDLRSDLDRCGINAATVFNDLVGICRDSEWQHTLLDDESND